MTDNQSPSCFISYSWEGEEHKEWVRMLARSYGFTAWMRTSISSNSRHYRHLGLSASETEIGLGAAPVSVEVVARSLEGQKPNALTAAGERPPPP